MANAEQLKALVKSHIERDDRHFYSVAMQVAAMGAQYVRKEEVPEDVIAREKEVLMAKGKESGKPEPVVAKMVDGQLAKWLKEICLLDQAFV